MNTIQNDIDEINRTDKGRSTENHWRKAYIKTSWVDYIYLACTLICALVGLYLAITN